MQKVRGAIYVKKKKKKKSVCSCYIFEKLFQIILKGLLIPTIES